MARLNTNDSTTRTEPAESSRPTSKTSRMTSTRFSSDPELAGSDKENQDSSKPSGKIIGKRRSNTAPMSDYANSPEHSSAKRQKVAQSSRAQPSQAAHRKELQERVDTTYYDPDQNEIERRATKKSLRDLFSKVNDSRAEYLQATSKGIENTLAEADEIYKTVKQTSVATIDSRLLVTVGDLAFKKVNTLTLGDSSTGVDVDDFVSQCIRFMKRAPTSQETTDTTQSTSSQARRRRQRPQGPGTTSQIGEDNDSNDEDEDDENAEPMNWSHLGKKACFLYNRRPCLSGFMLGPLSVQKKVRQPTQRRAREARADPSQATRPTELAAEDLEREETANLTVVCRDIAKLLDTFTQRATRELEREYNSLPYREDEPIPESVTNKLMAKHGITDNGCVPLFRFCVNPASFGQTVENLFYVSFLIKEGRVGMDFDSHGLPTIGVAEQRSMAQRQEAAKNQAVFTLDFDTWRRIIEAFEIEKSIIPHRKEEVWDDGTV